MPTSSQKIFLLNPLANQPPKKVPESQLFHLQVAYDFSFRNCFVESFLLAVNARPAKRALEVQNGKK
jgi:hypothetical protein